MRRQRNPVAPARHPRAARVLTFPSQCALLVPMIAASGKHLSSWSSIMIRFLAAGLALIVTISSSPLAAQEPVDAYQQLSDDGKALFNRYYDATATSSLPVDTAYNQLEDSRKTTFHAIVHAIDSLDIADVIASVDEIWGVTNSPDGRHQYRLSLTLTPDAVHHLRRLDNFGDSAIGHVKRPNGDLVGRAFNDFLPFSIFRSPEYAVSVRQKRPRRGPRRASVQISWIAGDNGDHTAGDIDIDYRTIRDTEHYYPYNSDVRFEGFGASHYDVHIRTYGMGLTEWWRIR